MLYSFVLWWNLLIIYHKSVQYKKQGLGVFQFFKIDDASHIELGELTLETVVVGDTKNIKFNFFITHVK